MSSGPRRKAGISDRLCFLRALLEFVRDVQRVRGAGKHSDRHAISQSKACLQQRLRPKDGTPAHPFG